MSDLRQLTKNHGRDLQAPADATGLDVSPSTARTVDACHLAPPWPVATPSSFNRFAIVRSDFPALRSRLIRFTTSSPTDLGRPNLTP